MVAVTDETALTVVAGKPFNKSIRIPTGGVWATVEELEVRAQLRQGKNTSSFLIENLHTHMSWVLDGDDLVITWSLSGAQTRALFAKSWGGESKKGYFTIIVSDVGIEDARAIVAPTIELRAVDTTTSAEGDV